MPLVYNFDEGKEVMYDLKDPNQKKEYMKHYHRMYREKNRDVVREHCRKAMAKSYADPVKKAERIRKVKEYYEALPDEVKAERRKVIADKARQKYHTNEEYRDKRKADMRMYYQKPEVKERMRLQYQKWVSENRTHYDELQKAYRERRKKSSVSYNKI